MFKHLTVLIILLVINYNHVKSQVKAVTEDGDTIYVYDNGRWSYDLVDDFDEMSNELGYLDMKLEIDTILTPFQVNASSSKEVKSKLEFFSIKYDPNEWKRIPPKNFNDDAEMAFESKNGNVYCVVISEEIEIGQENIVKIALNMMESRTGGNVDLKKVEKRNVNGKDILRGVYKVDFSGMNLVFDAYFYSGPSGTIQFTTWTGDKVWDRESKSTIQNLLNGLVIHE